jgi:hypothetical protein
MIEATPIHPATPITKTHPPSPGLPFDATLGSCFWMVAVAVLVLIVQLAVPQAYPLGQHPATGPVSLPHRYQPLAHVDVAVVVGTSVAGTTSVTPLDVSAVDDMGGHEVVIQSRPVRQQPDPAVARQA